MSRTLAPVAPGELLADFERWIADTQLQPCTFEEFVAVTPRCSGCGRLVDHYREMRGGYWECRCLTCRCQWTRYKDPSDLRLPPPCAENPNDWFARHTAVCR